MNNVEDFIVVKVDDVCVHLKDPIGHPLAVRHAEFSDHEIQSLKQAMSSSVTAAEAKSLVFMQAAVRKCIDGGYYSIKPVSIQTRNNYF